MADGCKQTALADALRFQLRFQRCNLVQKLLFAFERAANQRDGMSAYGTFETVGAEDRIAIFDGAQTRIDLAQGCARAKIGQKRKILHTVGHMNAVDQRRPFQHFGLYAQKLCRIRIDRRHHALGIERELHVTRSHGHLRRADPDLLGVDALAKPRATRLAA